MKFVKSMLAGLAIFGAASPAFAVPSATATIIRITGSTAFGPAMHAAICTAYATAGATSYRASCVGGSLASSKFAFYYGQINGKEVIIETSLNGSAAGVRDTANLSATASFLPDTLADDSLNAAYPNNNIVLANGAISSGGTTGISSGLQTNAQHPDVVMSDTFQGATIYKGTGFVDLINTKVGVVDFKFVTSKPLPAPASVVTIADSTAGSAILTNLGTTTGLLVGMSAASTSLPVGVTIKSIDSATQVTLSTGTNVLVGTGVSTTFSGTFGTITNITPQNAQALWTTGTAKLSLFTGNPLDNAVTVYAVGRDPFSGTRITMHAESGVGVDTPVNQYKPSSPAGNGYTAMTKWAGVVGPPAIAPGNNGEASGGTLAGYFAWSPAAGFNTMFVGYFGVVDGSAGTAIGNGGTELTYNGVPYSVANIIEGKYTFWGYEHLMYTPAVNAAGNATDTTKKNVADTIATNIITVTGPIKTGDMHCSRPGDGGVVTHN